MASVVEGMGVDVGDTTYCRIDLVVCRVVGRMCGRLRIESVRRPLRFP